MAYIDKDLAIKTAIDMCVKVVGHGITQIDAVDIADAFENIPTADVVEVKHGKWSYEYSSDVLVGTDATYDWTCSACKEMSVDNTAFCPNCGAKMDGKDINVPTNGRSDT